MSNDQKYDAIFVVSFGGPEKNEDVIPYLENVLRGKNVPRERLEEVAEHYYKFNGKSPINDQNLALISALSTQLKSKGINLPIYFGNRNWHPMIQDTLAEMHRAGVRHALGFVTSIFSSYSGCRQYRENIQQAIHSLQGNSPTVDKIRVFYNHPHYIEAVTSRINEAIADRQLKAEETHIVFCAHSIPSSMASRCAYERQFHESSRLTASGFPYSWSLAYQSRSGPPSQPWLEPDVSDVLAELPSKGIKNVLCVPIGFISDHMEVMYDLDIEAKQTAGELGLNFTRVKSVGTHPVFVKMVAELIEERLDSSKERLSTGVSGPSHDVCPVNCCLPA
jgi:ferrochelatase